MSIEVLRPLWVSPGLSAFFAEDYASPYPFFLDIDTFGSTAETMLSFPGIFAFFAGFKKFKLIKQIA